MESDTTITKDTAPSGGAEVGQDFENLEVAKNCYHADGEKQEVLPSGATGVDDNDIKINVPDNKTCEACQCQHSQKVTLKKNITTLHGVCLIVGTIIGSGIFISPNKVSKTVNSPAMSICVWIAGGALSTVGAITFVELGLMFPQNGGVMIYLRKAFGGCLSFLSCWLIHVLLGGLRRAIGFLIFGKYFWAVFYDPPDAPPDWANTLLCIFTAWCIIGIITVFPDLTLKVIDVVTFFKLFSLGLVIMLGVVHLCQGHTENIAVGFRNTSWEPQLWGEGWNSVLWAYSGWNSISIMLGEVKDPSLLPKIIAISMSIVTTLYVMAIISYHTVLPMPVMRSNQPLASILAKEKMGGSGEVIFAVSVAVSTFGNAVTALLASSRFLQAGGATNILPSCFSLISKRFRSPIFSLLYLVVGLTIFIAIGNVFTFINTASFTSFVFITLSAVALLIMRKTKPDIPRPIKVSLFFPIATILMGTYLFIVPWFTNWDMCALWMLLTLAGVPIYFVCVRGYFRPAVFVRVSQDFTKLLQKLLNAE